MSDPLCLEGELTKTRLDRTVDAKVGATNNGATMQPAYRLTRDTAISTAVGAVILNDLVRIISAYDKVPGQTWCFLPNWFPHDRSRLHSSSDMRSITFGSTGVMRAVRGSSTFEHGARRWKVRVSYAVVCWLGIVDTCGLTELIAGEFGADFPGSKCIYFGSTRALFEGGLLHQTGQLPNRHLQYNMDEWVIFEVDVSTGTLRVGVHENEMVVFNGLSLDHCTPYVAVSASGGTVTIESQDE